MKNFRTHALCICMILMPRLCFAQISLPDDNWEPPSNARFYYENQGQITDVDGNPQDDIKYYTERGVARIFLMENGVSFNMTQRGDPQIPTPDTGYRIDLNFINEIRPTIVAEEQSQDVLNYYLPHCPGGITDVPGYARIIYQGAFPDIDFHCYSNSSGPVNYIVLHPGANPNDILFQFSGQDSIAVLANALALFVGSHGMAFPQATAYQVIAGAVVPLGWNPVWAQAGGGIVTMSMGAYDPAETLVIKLGLGAKTSGIEQDLRWGTYYGVEANESGSHICTFKDTMFAVMQEYHTLFYPQNGTYSNIPIQNYYNSCYISKFTSAHVRTHATYYGGTAETIPNTISAFQGTTPEGSVVIAGSTLTDQLPLGSGPGYQQTTKFSPPNVETGFIAFLRADNLQLRHGSYFGGYWHTWITSSYVSQDAAGEPSLIIAGNVNMYEFLPTQSDNPPTASSSGGSYFPVYGIGGAQYVQTHNNTTTNDVNGFIAEFAIGGADNNKLLWSTVIGGNNWEDVNKVMSIQTATENVIYLVGKTESVNTQDPGDILPDITDNPVNGGFPLANDMNSGAYFQNTYTPAEGFIAKFSSSRNLEWCTYFGGTAADQVVSIAHNSQNHVFITGETEAYQGDYNNCQSNTSGFLPLCQDALYTYWIQNGAGGNRDVYIAEFNPANELQWSTFFGGTSEDIAGDIKIDANDNIFVGLSSRYTDGYTPTSASAPPVVAAYPTYNQPANACTNTTLPELWDAFVAKFDNSHQLVWSTFYGGCILPPGQTVKEVLTGMIVMPADTVLIITGETNSNITPVNDSDPASSLDYYDPVFTGNNFNNFPTPMLSTPDVYFAAFNIKNLSATGIKDPAKLFRSRLTVYPNPAGDQCRLLFEAGQAGKAVISVVSSMGQTVLVKKEQANKGMNEIILPVSGLSSGIYFVTVSTGSQRLHQKLTKL